MHSQLEDVTITDTQASRIEEWLAANKTVPGWLDSYELGRTYIDTRANGGKGITARRRYVQLDHAVAKEVPELAGRKPGEIREFMADRAAKADQEISTGPRM